MYQQALGGYMQEGGDLGGGYMTGGDLGGIASDVLGDIAKMNSGLYKALNRTRMNKDGQPVNYISLVPRPDLDPYVLDRAMVQAESKFPSINFARQPVDRVRSSTNRQLYYKEGGIDGMLAKEFPGHPGLAAKYGRRAFRQYNYYDSEKGKAARAKAKAKYSALSDDQKFAKRMAAYERHKALGSADEWGNFYEAPAQPKRVDKSAPGYQALVERLARGRATAAANRARYGRNSTSDYVRSQYTIEGPNRITYREPKIYVPKLNEYPINKRPAEAAADSSM